MPVEADAEKQTYKLHRRIENLEIKIENISKNVDDIKASIRKLDREHRVMKQQVQNFERYRIEMLNTRLLNLETVVYR